MKTSAKKSITAAARPEGASAAPASWTAIIPHRAPAAALASVNVPAKWRWHRHVLAALQERLLRERGDSLVAAAEPLESHSLNEADSATDEFDHDLALVRLASEQDALFEVNDALKRIQNGTYGVCETTGKAIPAARLRAIPWARCTREAEARREMKGAGHQTRLTRPATVRGGRQVRFLPEAAPEEGEAEIPTANDERLTPVDSPPLQPVQPPKPARRPRRTAKRNGQHP